MVTINYAKHKKIIKNMLFVAFLFVLQVAALTLHLESDEIIEYELPIVYSTGATENTFLFQLNAYRLSVGLIFSHV